MAQDSRSSLLASVTATPAADARVSQSSRNKNYGTSTYLQVDGGNTGALRSYIRFNVSGVTGSIQAATLRVYCTTNGTTNGPAVYLAGSNWIESGKNGITWNNQPTLLSGATADSGAISTGTWVAFDVTSLVSGNGTYTFALIADSTDAVTLSSREGNNPPQLVVSSMATPTSTLSPTPTSPAGTATSTATATPTIPDVTPTSTYTPTPTSLSAFTDTPTPTSFVTATPTLPPAATDTPTPTLFATNTPTLSPTSTSTPGATGPIQHVFLVLMENHGYNQVWNTTSSPYITQLGNTYSRAANYYAITHPSLPNYIDLIGGSNYSITTDCSPSSTCHVDAPNLADSLEAAGLSWRGYFEAMPSPCYLKTSTTYVARHNPFVYFDDIRLDTARCNSHDVPYTYLSADLAAASTTPNFVFLKPDLCNDMHDCPVSTGDTWLSNQLPTVLNSPACTQEQCLLILTWDEDGNTENNHVLTIFAGPAAQSGGFASLMPYNHFSLLRTIEHIFGLPTLTANDGSAAPMTDLLR